MKITNEQKAEVIYTLAQYHANGHGAIELAFEKYEEFGGKLEWEEFYDRVHKNLRSIDSIDYMYYPHREQWASDRKMVQEFNYLFL